MNRDETRALWSRGAESWNEWALETLERKKILENSGEWSVDWFGEGLNDTTRLWLAGARADFEGMEFASDADFSGLAFPGPAIFNGAHFIGQATFSETNFVDMAHFKATQFDGLASFKSANFHSLANFEEAAFASDADFDQAEFLRETTGPLVPAARFQKTRFLSHVSFRKSSFVGISEFMKTQFAANARFDEAELKTDAVFEGAVFQNTAGFVKTRFSGAAKFGSARFCKDARFGEAEFADVASFEDAEFSDNATFRFVKFGGETTYQSARFDGEARFTQSSFAETVIFRSCHLAGAGDFTACRFEKAVDFNRCKFDEDTTFEKSVFLSPAEFAYAKFKRQVTFSDVVFTDKANFLMTTFRGRTIFRDAAFQGAADFSGIQCRAAFVLSGAVFQNVPDFHDASFQDPPSLDSMLVADPVSFRPVRGDEDKKDPRTLPMRFIQACGDRAYAARYRRLSKLAAATQDFEREREFFAQELRCRRFWHDRPLGRGMARFWFGWVYGVVSNFGRSITRPLLLWGLTILVFSLVYLGLRRADYFETAGAPIADTSPVLPGWPPNPDFIAILEWAGSMVWWFIMSIFNLFAGGGCISGGSGATAEALFLSFKNSLFFLGWESPDTIRRVYGCLYGFESATPGGEVHVHVPLSVSVAATLENMIGLICIVLFVIAARNLLRTR